MQLITVKAVGVLARDYENLKDLPEKMGYVSELWLTYQYCKQITDRVGV